MRDAAIFRILATAAAVLAMSSAPAVHAADQHSDSSDDLDVTMTVVPQNADIQKDVTQEIKIPRADTDSGKDRDEAHQSDTAKQHKADAADTHDGLEQAGEARNGGNRAAKEAGEAAQEAAESAEEASHSAEQAAHQAHESANEAQNAADDVRRDTENQGHGQGNGNGHGHSGGGD